MKYYLCGILAILFLGGLFSAFKSSDAAIAPSELRKGYMLTVTNDNLVDNLEQNFANLVDEINRVDAHSNENFGTYYVVYGKKDSEKTFFSLKVENEDIKNKTYSHIDFASIRKQGLLGENEMTSSMVLYCAKRPYASCHPYTPWPTFPICGIKTRWGCIAD